jgi:hypothetical protein
VCGSLIAALNTGAEAQVSGSAPSTPSSQASDAQEFCVVSTFTTPQVEPPPLYLTRPRQVPEHKAPWQPPQPTYDPNVTPETSYDWSTGRLSGGPQIVPDAAGLIRSFQGITQTPLNPPDPAVAAGPNHVVMATNNSWAIYAKDGTRQFSTTFFQWLAPLSPPTSLFDPKVVYDANAGRWILLILSLETSPQRSQIWISVSENSNPNGNWAFWKIDGGLDNSTPSGLWADYPGLGYDSSEAVYVTTNQFTYGSPASFRYAKIRILYKSQLYWAGSPGSLTWWDLAGPLDADGTASFTVMPAQAGSALSGGYFLSTRPGGGNAVTLFRVTNPLARPPQFDRQATVPIGAYTAPPNAAQLGGSTPIHVGGCRATDVWYQGGKLVMAFTEGHNWGSGNVSAVRTLSVNAATSALEVNERYGGNGAWLYYPAMIRDASGNFGLVFTRSSASEYANARYSVRWATDTLFQSSSSLKDGESYYVNFPNGDPNNRWGDYAGIALDPSNASTAWMCSEYSWSGNQWATWIGQIPLSSSPPPAPGATSASNVSSSGFTANWNAVPNVVGYRLDVSTSSTFSTYLSGYQDLDVNNVTSRAVTGLSAGTTYYYRVRAYSGGTSGNSNVISVTTAVTAPAAPVATSASSVTTSSFNANWNSASGANGYRLDVSTSNSFATFVTGYANLDVGNVTTRSVTGLNANTTYYYRVRAYNLAGTSSSSNVITVGTGVTTPPTPVATSASSVTSSGFRANWDSATGANGYRLDVSTSSNFGTFVSGYADLDVGNVTSRTLSGLSTSTTYYYRVRAYNSAGTSSSSNVITVTTGAAVGSLQVTISPAGAVSAGAQWQVDGGAYQNSGVTVSNLSVGSHIVAFKPVSGWTTPSNQTVNVTANTTATTSGTYAAIPMTGSLQVTIAPAEAVSAGAQWQVDGGAYQNSGATLSNLSTGSHTLSFKPVSGWTTPPNQTVTVSGNATTNASGTYAAALQLVEAVSMKSHASGTYGILLPLTGAQGIECRTGGATGNHTLVFTFNRNITGGTATVTSGVGSVSGAPSIAGSTMIVQLTSVVNAQRLTVSLSNVTDTTGQVLPTLPVTIGFLAGDTSGSGSVNATDIGQTKAQSGQAVTASNFRMDVTASGTSISASDVGLVKSSAGTQLPAQ